MEGCAVIGLLLQTNDKRIQQRSCPRQQASDYCEAITIASNGYVNNIKIYMMYICAARLANPQREVEKLHGWGRADVIALECLSTCAGLENRSPGNRRDQTAVLVDLMKKSADERRAASVAPECDDLSRPLS
jgi:hypothetical protein